MVIVIKMFFTFFIVIGMLMKRMLFLFSILLFCPTARVFSISNTQAKVLTVATGVASFGLIKVCSKNTLLSTLAGGGGLLAGFFFWNFFTPENRLKRAKSKINKIEGNPIASKAFEDESGLLDALEECYVTSDLPLITGYNGLSQLLAESVDAVELVIAAKEEAPSFEFSEHCDICLARLKEIKKNIIDAVKAIRKNEKYLKQLEIHKKEQAHKEQLAVQQSMANAQWHSANAQWKKASDPATQNVNMFHH
jgi:hypothetical protein